MTTWTQNYPGGDRWTLDEHWTVRRRGGKWFAHWDGTRLSPPHHSAERAIAHVLKLIAEERAAPAAGTEKE